MDPKPNASYGALISIILILAIVVVGAFYVWDQRVSEQGQNMTLPTQNMDDTGSTTDASTTETF